MGSFYWHKGFCASRGLPARDLQVAHLFDDKKRRPGAFGRLARKAVRASTAFTLGVWSSVLR